MTINRPSLEKQPARGEVWWVDFDPVKGEEIRKSRPAIVLSSNSIRPLKIKLVVPLTSWQEKFSLCQWMVKIVADGNNHLERDSAADALQLRCVSFERFNSRLGTVPNLVLDEITASVAIVIEYR